MDSHFQASMQISRIAGRRRSERRSPTRSPRHNSERQGRETCSWEKFRPPDRSSRIEEEEEEEKIVTFDWFSSSRQCCLLFVCFYLKKKRKRNSELYTHTHTHFESVIQNYTNTWEEKRQKKEIKTHTIESTSSLLVASLSRPALRVSSFVSNGRMFCFVSNNSTTDYLQMDMIDLPTKTRIS